MRRTNFPVVTGVMAVLVGIAFLTRVLEPYVPPASSPHVSHRTDEFVAQGASQPVAWRPLDRNRLSEARLSNRPLLLLIGVSGSTIAAELDRAIFTDADVARYLNMNFTCIRIDGLQHPQWVNAFLPMSRLWEDIRPGFQIWGLHPNGTLLGVVTRTARTDVFSPDTVLDRLIAMRQMFDQIESGSIATSAAELMQRNDITILSSMSGFHQPDLDRYRRSLLARTDDIYGGFPRRGLQELSPLAHQYLARSGDAEGLRKAFDPMLLSPMADPIDGGFFRVARSPDYRQIEFNKSIIENADMLVTLTLSWKLTGDPLYQWLAQRLFFYLSVAAHGENRLAAFQIAGEPGKARSTRYSFNQALLRETVPQDLRAWMRGNLGLDVMTNPQMSPYLTSRDVLEDPMLEPALTRLREVARRRRVLTGEGYAEIECHVAARVIEAARLSGDVHWLEVGLRMSESLEPFRVGSEVRRRIPKSEYAPPYLGDSLAYADAKLQEYLAAGRVTALDQGLAVLRRALSQFQGDRDGEYTLVPRPGPLPNSDLPELADNLRESCSARILRLSSAYGTLFRDTDAGLQLLAVADAVMTRFAAIAHEGGSEVAGYFNAALFHLTPTYVLCVGERAEEESLSLAASLPPLLCSPAVGPIRRDVQEMGEGVYVVTYGQVEGPFTREQAMRHLALAAQPSIAP